jgi:hypothetical protein
MDLFSPGGCTKEYAYSEEDLAGVESIDKSITGRSWGRTAITIYNNW